MKISINKSIPAETSDVQRAIKHIKCALDILSSAAVTNDAVREAVVNLGVVAIDLNSTDSSSR